MILTLTITGDKGRTIFHANAQSVDSMIQELGRFERNILPKLESTNMQKAKYE